MRGCETILAASDAENRDLTEDEQALFNRGVERFDALMEQAGRSNPSAPVFVVRADLKRFLREAGLPRAAAKRVAAGGWPALDPGRARAELLDSIKAATARLSRKD